MKKITLLIAAALLATSGIAFAIDATIPTGTPGDYVIPSDGTVSYQATKVGAGVTFQVKPSANVGTTLAADANGTAYVAGTYHSSGTKSYATSSVDAKIYMKENASQAADAVAKPVTVAEAQAGTWTGFTAVK